jgi:hypothetical protein
MPGRVLKNPFDAAAFCPCLVRRATDADAGASARSRATIRSIDPFIVGGCERVAPSAAAAGSGTSPTTAATRAARGKMPRHDVILSVTNAPLLTRSSAQSSVEVRGRAKRGVYKKVQPAELSIPQWPRVGATRTTQAIGSSQSSRMHRLASMCVGPSQQALVPPAPAHAD